MIKYYLLDNRIVEQTKDENGVVIGYCVKQPVFMKKYPYYKLSFKPDGSQCIVQAYEEVVEARELTLEEAQAQTDAWFKENEKLGNEKPRIMDKPNGEKDIIEPKPLDVKSYAIDKVKDEVHALRKRMGA